MSATTTAPSADPLARRVPPLGGFNLTFVQIEIRRLLRNRRTLFFTFIMPPLFYLLFGGGSSNKHTSVGHGNITAYVMVSS